MFDIFDFSDIMEDFSDLIDDIKEDIDDLVNDIRIIGRDFKKDIQDEIEINSIGIPVVEQLVSTANTINDSMKTLGKTISNPLSIGELITDFSKLKKADHIFVNRLAYTHHGIYVGDDTVIHYAPDNSDVCIHEISIYDFAEFNIVYRFNKSNSLLRYSPDEVVKRAYSRIYETDYNLIFNNCEHFARWCRCGDNY